MQHITLSEVKAACLVAHKDGRLLAQAPFGSYAYSRVDEDGGTLVCAIGAVLNPETLEMIEMEDLNCATLETDPNALHEIAFTWSSEEFESLRGIQKSHDSWNNCHDRESPMSREHEKDFLALIS